MRTTVTLDADTESLVRRLMVRRGISFKQALNDAIRRGAGVGGQDAFATRTRPMGAPRAELEKSLRLAGELEDEELMRRMASGQ